MTRKETLAYITGLIDGEGYIGIKKDVIKGRGVNPSHYGKISVAGTEKQMVDLFMTFFGCGNIYLHKHSKLGKRGYWSWETSNLKATFVIKQIYPYLRIKKPEADMVLKLSKTFQKKYYIVPKEVIAVREKLYQGVKDLHTFS